MMIYKMVATAFLVGSQIFTMQAENLNPRPIMEMKANAALITLDYSPDGKKIVVGGQTNELTIYDVQ